MPFRPDSVTIHDEHAAHYAAIERAALAGRRPEAAIWKGLLVAVRRLKRDGNWGEVIPKTSIPREFVRRYAVKNLYCVDLADFHRALYTIVGHRVIFLDLVDHAQSDKWFPNKGK